MADEFDRASELEEQHRQQALANRPRFEFDPGAPGECDICGRWSGRLVRGACAPCRDQYKLP
jgi:hypothetical protein